MQILKLSINELELTPKGTFINSKNNDLLFEYNETFKTTLELEPVNSYKEVKLSNLSNPFLLVLSSDRAITAKINGFEFINTKRLVLNIPIESIELLNLHVYPAVVSLEAYGIQKA